MELVNKSFFATFSANLEYVPVFEPANALQGLGCKGDDGTYNILFFPSFLEFNGTTLSGIVQDFGTFNFQLEVVGAEGELCDVPVIWFTETITMTVFPPRFWWSKNFIYKNFGGPINGKAICSILVENYFKANVYEKIAGFEESFPYSEFPISTITPYFQNEIDAYLEANKLSGNLGAVIEEQVLIIRRFRLLVDTKNADGTDASESEGFSAEIVLMGGLNDFDYYMSNKDGFSISIDILNTIQNGGWFYYNQEVRKIAPQQPEFLSVLCAGNSEVVIVYQKSDNTTEQITRGSFNYWCINLLQYAPEDTVSITAQMRRNGVFYGPVRTYLIDNQYYRYQRFIVFRNSKGAIETVRCTGELATEIGAAEKVISERIMRANMHLSIQRNFVWKSGKTTTQKSLATGWISINYRQYLAEQLMNTNEAYEHDAATGQFIPIILTAKKMQAFQDNEYLFGLIIDYTYAF